MQNSMYMCEVYIRSLLLSWQMCAHVCTLVFVFGTKMISKHPTDPLGCHLNTEIFPVTDLQKKNCQNILLSVNEVKGLDIELCL